MKAYHEYLELHSYFARGEEKLSSEAFAAADREFKELAALHPKLDGEQQIRLVELKALLYRERP